MIDIDINSLTLADVSKLRAIVAENTEMIEKVQEMLAKLQESPRATLAFMTSDNETEIATMNSLIESLQEENTVAEDLIGKAETHVKA